MTNYLPLIFLLSAAVVIDWRERRIPNWLNGITLLMGIIFATAGWVQISPVQCLFGVLAGGLLVLPRYALGITGAGDLKQHMAVGAWVGPVGILFVLLAATVIGAVVAVAQAARAGKFNMLCRNTAVLSVNLLNVRVLGVDHVNSTGRSFKSIDRPLPYALPMLGGIVAVLTLRSMFGFMSGFTVGV